MTIESIPTFTAPTAKLWAAILADARKMLLSNAWCGKCGDGDRTVFSATGGVISDHTLKHVVAALAAYGVERQLRLFRML